MLFSVDQETEELEHLSEQEFEQLDILEREHLQEWVIEEPQLLGERLMVISSEYAKFRDLHDRLDLLAIDPQGKLVVVELKRDKADRTTDLQALKYAGYCATLTAEEIQRDYQAFWTDRRDGDELSVEEVGEVFVEFLNESVTGDVPYVDEGWANLELDDRPRILLAAGSFGPEITAPVMWLTEEYDMDITCTRIQAYSHRERTILNSQQVIPVPEAEEYLTKRRKKQEQQKRTSITFTLPVLLKRGVLQSGDVVIFDKTKVPDDATRAWSAEDDYWRAHVTGMAGQQDNLEWLHTGNQHSFTGLTKQILAQTSGRDEATPLNGYRYWTHQAFDDRTLFELREATVDGDDRVSVE